MNKFTNLPLTKPAEKTEFLDKITQILNKIVQKLQEKLLNKEIKCECANDEEICFDCLRFEAEIILADDFTLDNIDEQSLEMYSDLFEHELDKQVATIVTTHEENI
jgi:nicotinate-nucleotide pyrophosphorylase